MYKIKIFKPQFTKQSSQITDYFLSGHLADHLKVMPEEVSLLTIYHMQSGSSIHNK